MLVKRHFAELLPGDKFLWSRGGNSQKLKCWKTPPQFIKSKIVSNTMSEGKPIFVLDDEEVDLIILP